MDPTTAQAAPRDVWHLNPKGTKVRVIAYDEASKYYTVESERGVKTPVPGTYPLTPLAPDAPAGKVGIEQLVGRPRDQVEPHLGALSENELENLGARDTRMWVTDAVMKEIDRRARLTPALATGALSVAAPDTTSAREGGRLHRASNGARVNPFKADSPYGVAWLAGYDETPLSRAVASVAPSVKAVLAADAVAAIRAGRVTLPPLVPCLLCGVAYPAPTGLNHSHAECKANIAQQKVIEEPAEVLAATIPTAPTSDAIRSAAGDSVATPPNPEAERIPEAGGRSAAYMLGRAAFGAGRPEDAALLDGVDPDEWTRGWLDAEALALSEPGFIKRVESASNVAENRAENLPPSSALNGLPESVARGLEASPSTIVSAASARGYCPDCGREGERLKNGAIRQHQALGARPGAEKCEGSGKPALSAPAPKPAPVVAPAPEPMSRQEFGARMGAERIAQNQAAPDEWVRSRLSGSLHHVEHGTGSALGIQEDCDDCLEAREFLRPHLRPVLDLLERLPLGDEGWNKVASHLRAALTALAAHPPAAQESQTTPPTATANGLPDLPENAPQSSAANAEPGNERGVDESAAATPPTRTATAAPEAAPDEVQKPISPAEAMARLLTGTVRESAAALAGCYDPEVLRMALRWEAEHQRRPTVLSRLEERLHRIETGTAKPRREEVPSLEAIREANRPVAVPIIDNTAEALRALVSLVQAAACLGVRVEITITPDPTLLPFRPE